MAKHKSNTLKLKFDTGWSYAPAPESKSAVHISPQYDLFINGKFEKPLSKKYFPTINPASEEKISEIAEANNADVDKAINAARKAYENYRVPSEYSTALVIYGGENNTSIPNTLANFPLRPFNTSHYMWDSPPPGSADGHTNTCVPCVRSGSGGHGSRPGVRGELTQHAKNQG